MGAIDINALTGKLKTLAEEIDRTANGGNGNSKIDEGAEYSLFESKARQAVDDKEIKNKDFKKIFGYSAKKANEEAKEAAEDAAERREDYIIRNLTASVNEAGSLEEVLSSMYTRLGELCYDENYEELVEETALVKSFIPTFNSEDDVKKIHDTVKKELKKLGKWDDFHKDILEQLERLAEKEQRTKEYNEVKAKFYGIYPNETKNLKEAFKKTEKAFKGKKSYYKDALENLMKTDVPQEAAKIQREAIAAQDGTSYRKVRKGANKLMKEEGTYDKSGKYFNTKVKKRSAAAFVTGNDKDYTVTAEVQARQNRIEKAKTQTEAEILDALGGSKDLFDVLVSSGLIVKNADGTYDLSDLSDLIATEVGMDGCLNKSSKKYKTISEKLGTYTELRVQLGLDNKTLTDREAKKLVELCGFDVEGKNWAQIAMYATIGAVCGAVTVGAASAGSDFENEYKKNESISAEMYVDTANPEENYSHIYIDGELQADGDSPFTISGLDDLEDGVDVVLTLTTSLDKLTDIVIKGGSFVLSNALKGALIGGAIGLVDGLLRDNKTEIPVAEINFDCMSLQDYIERINAKNPEWAGALSAIAVTFSDDEGNWNCEAYRAFLRQAAGNDILNKAELLAALKDYKSELENSGSNDSVDNNGGSTITPADDDCEECEAIQCKDEDTTESRNLQSKTAREVKTWVDGAGTFYPCLAEQYGPGKAGQILKAAQAVTDGNYSTERLTKLVNMSVSEIKKLSDDCGIDKDYYVSLRLATVLPENVYMPDSIGDCSFQDGTVGRVNVTLGGTVNKAGTPSTAPAYRTTVKGKEYVQFCDGTKIEISEGKTARDVCNEREAQLREQGCNVKITLK